MGSRVSMLTSKRSQAPTKSQFAQKKTPVKKVSPVKKVVAKEVAVKQPIKKVESPKKDAKKTIPIKKKVVSKPEKELSVKKAPAEKPVEAPPKPSEPVVKEFNVADAAGSSDKVIREIYRHLTIPPGINDVEVFTMTFDIDDNGKVVNLKPKGSEPLVIYTAFKDALLRCTMPIKNRKNIPLVIK